MAKKKKNNIDIRIILILIIVALSLIAVLIRYKTHVEETLACTKDITDEYRETQVFKYDSDNTLYSYSRAELLHDMSEEGLNSNYEYFNSQLESLKDKLSENFRYTIEKEEGKLFVKTYINVKVYPAFFNQYINNESINSSSSISDIEKFLINNEYKCEIKRR